MALLNLCPVVAVPPGAGAVAGASGGGDREGAFSRPGPPRPTRGQTPVFLPPAIEDGGTMVG